MEITGLNRIEGLCSVVFSKVYIVEFQKGSILCQIVQNSLTQFFSHETYSVGSGGVGSMSEREDVARSERVMNGSWNTLRAVLDRLAHTSERGLTGLAFALQNLFMLFNPL